MTEAKIGFTIKTVAERTGVSVHTLRAWERRYGVPSPNRNADNRYRLYDEQDIADVLFMKQHVQAGVLPSQASALLRQRQTRSIETTTQESRQPIVAMQASLLEAFARSDEATARELLDQAFAMVAPESVALEIIEPTMRAIGERWVRNELTVWQEHLASNVIQQKLFSVLQSQPESPPMSPHLVAACAPSEEHQLGLVIFALLARRQGWRVSYLGQGTPLADILHLARQAKPNAIVISVTTVIGLAGLIPWLDVAKRPTTPLVFGGYLPNVLPSLREHLPGSWLGEDVMAAVRRLTSVQPCEHCWTPPKRAWQLANALQSQRLKLAGNVASTFIATLPATLQRKWDTANINFATLFLVDALSCAVAFEVPDLMDWEHQWIMEAMPPRSVSPSLIAKHLETFKMILRKSFSGDELRLLYPLIRRMEK